MRHGPAGIVVVAAADVSNDETRSGNAVRVRTPPTMSRM
jgi:hypothetical protein